MNDIFCLFVSKFLVLNEGYASICRELNHQRHISHVRKRMLKRKSRLAIRIKTPAVCTVSSGRVTQRAGVHRAFRRQRRRCDPASLSSTARYWTRGSCRCRVNKKTLPTIRINNVRTTKWPLLIHRRRRPGLALVCQPIHPAQPTYEYTPLWSDLRLTIFN